MRKMRVVATGLLCFVAQWAHAQSFERQVSQISQEVSGAALQIRRAMAASQGKGPTFARKYFAKYDLQGEDTRNTTTRVNRMYGVSVMPFRSNEVGFYAQAGRGKVTTERWLDRTVPDGSRSIGVTTKRAVIVIVGTSFGF